MIGIRDKNNTANVITFKMPPEEWENITNFRKLKWDEMKALGFRRVIEFTSDGINNQEILYLTMN